MKNVASRSAVGDAVPGALNIVLTVAAGSAALVLLWLASHTDAIALRIGAAIAFSFVNNTLFSLMHEAVHGIFHARRTVNESFGRLAAAFFPTGLGFQRICHLGHHRRNRSDAELFDYVRPGDNRLMKFLQWYGILTGVYWLLSPLAALTYLLSPRLLGFSVRLGGKKLADQTSAAAMLSGFKNAPARTIRLEILLSFLLQAAFFLALDLSVAGWATCYAAFALNWSSLQYADHAWSVRDVHDGAWNLEVNPLVRYLFLNYHHHLAHHRHPNVSWLHLGKHVDPRDERPSFLAIYLKMWLGPRPYLGDARQAGRDEA